MPKPQNRPSRYDRAGNNFPHPGTATAYPIEHAPSTSSACIIAVEAAVAGLPALGERIHPTPARRKLDARPSLTHRGRVARTLMNPLTPPAGLPVRAGAATAARTPA